MFLAEHTVQDIRDLAHAKDAEITAIEAARAEFVGPFSDPTWDNEWRQFRASYEAAKSNALEDKTSVPFLDDSMRIADADYRAFVATLEPLYDLVVREQHAIGKLHKVGAYYRTRFHLFARHARRGRRCSHCGKFSALRKK